MDEIVTKIFDDGNLIFIIGGGIAIIAIVFGAIKGIVTNGSRERSRREIAAYIAEGSMTPEQGERLMNAGEKKSC
ncbi:MAG: hypothetical protein Phyf2KO_16720 [Phycisphaerales bacterium]